jgi:FMN phosphatase YigB (HAD superfamily)
MSLVEKLGCVMFDLDGTLIRTSKDYYEKQFGLVFDHFHIEKDKNIFRKLWFDDNRSSIVNSLGVDARDFWEHYNEIEDPELRKKCISLYDDMDCPVLHTLSDKGIKTAVITSTTENVMIMEVDFFGSGIFDACYSTYKSRAQKSSLISECIDKFGIESSRCVYVGNSDRDIVQPRILGIKSILVDRKEYPFRKKPDYKVDNLKDILELP